MASLIRDRDELAENHEINVTPFIDVMLVLLIIFMVAAPLATVDINVDLPRSGSAAAQRPDAPVWLTVMADGALRLGERPVTREGLAAGLGPATGDDPEARIFLRADKAVSYGTVMEVMNAVRSAGWTKIALVGLATAGPEAGAAGATQP